MRAGWRAQIPPLLPSAIYLYLLFGPRSARRLSLGDPSSTASVIVRMGVVALIFTLDVIMLRAVLLHQGPR